MLSKPVAIAVALAVLLVGGTSWLLIKEKRAWSDRAFDACVVEDGDLVLKYEYGAADDLRTSVRQRDGQFEVRLEAHTQGGMVPAILLHGELRLDGWSVGDDPSVTQHDGSRLDCATS